MFGYLSGCITAATLQPIENVKMVMIVPPKEVKLTKNFLRNIVISINYLSNDGKRAFYRGLVPNVLRTGFSSSIYFSFLRFCESLSGKYESTATGKVTTFLSSLFSRIFSSFASNPLSVIQTRYQYGGKQRWSGGVLKNLYRIYKLEGISGLWKGGLTSCYKEGLFAGIYYVLYQQGKMLGIQSFLAGIISGIISTTLTHPLQIVRAQLQSFVITQNELGGISISRQLKMVVKTG